MADKRTDTFVLLIGNSDGIGLAMTRRLLAGGWDVAGVSRSASPIDHSSYAHYATNVTAADYPDRLATLTDKKSFDLCIYLAGIGELLDLANMGEEPHIVDVNLLGMVRTAAAVIPGMVERGSGHFIGLSSLADELVSAEAPSYHASKAGFSSYLACLAKAVKPKGVHVTNVRFGFVDTKMAKDDRKPFMMSVERAVDHIEHCMKRKPAVYTAPKIAIPFVKLHKLITRLSR